MDDLISRRAAIDALYRVDEYNGRSVEAIRNLPSAERTGKWVKVNGYATPGGDPVWKCSKCGKGRHIFGIEHGSYGTDVADHQWVACPNCGARMLNGGE